MSPAERAAVTYRYDLRQAFFQGMCETSWVTFGLLIAIRGFGAEGAGSPYLDTIKGLIPAAHSIGLLLTPLILSLAARSGWRASRVIALLVATAGVLVLAASQAQWLLLFAALWICANILSAQQVALMTQIYAWNYVTSQRGKRLAMTFLVAATGGLIFSSAWGVLLDRSFELFPVLIGMVGAACLCGAYFIHKIPSEPFPATAAANPVRSFSLVWQDKLFGIMLVCWMFIGIGNMMTIPIRIEYLADPQYGINASNAEIAASTLIIPFVVRFASARLWGALFDRIHFVAWRIGINLCFILGTAFYFFTTSLLLIYIGAVFFGLAMGGGTIAWNLWVTKIAPPDKVGTYMSIHTWLTGARGVMSPFLGYWLLGTSAAMVGTSAIISLLIGTLLFAAIYHHPRFRS